MISSRCRISSSAHLQPSSSFTAAPSARLTRSNSSSNLAPPPTPHPPSPALRRSKSCGALRAIELHPSTSWYEANRIEINAWLQNLATRQFATAPVAIFDWDETSFAGNLALTCLIHVITELKVRVPPEKMAELIPECPASVTHFRNGVSIADLRADILDAYAILWPLMTTGQKEVARTLSEYQDFCAKVLVYYSAFCQLSEVPLQDGYLWLRWLADYSPEQMHTLAAEACADAAAKPFAHHTWRSATAGRAGVQAYSYVPGVAAQHEIIDLMMNLIRVGVKVHVVSGNIQELVRGSAGHFSYPLPPHNIHGGRADLNDLGLTTGKIADFARHPFMWMAGKAHFIANHIPGPQVLVAGDSDGDYDMLVAFDATELRLVIHQGARGRMESLYAVAQHVPAEQREQGHRTVTLLQGRDAHTGKFCPSQNSTTIPK